MKLACKECKQPLIMQQSLGHMLKESYIMLDENQKKEQAEALQELYQGFGDTTDNVNQIEVEMKVKDLAEGPNPEVKYPVCFDCFDSVISKMDQKIKQKEGESQLYMEQLARLEGKINQCKQQNRLEEELKQLEGEEYELDKQFSALDLEEEELGKKEQEMAECKRSLLKDEKQFWEEVNVYERRLVDFQEDLSQANGQIENLDVLYKRLKKTNFIKEVFYISSIDEFGTISGFRLGRLPTIDVKWDEINAALGQSLYLLVVLAHRFNYKIEKFHVTLAGSYSKIALKSNPKQKFELYNLAVPSNEERFNQGLAYLLESLNMLQIYVSQNYQHLKNNIQHKALFKIENDLISGISIKYNYNDLPNWTRACKYFLTNLQWLVYMSAVRDQFDQTQQTF